MAVLFIRPMRTNVYFYIDNEHLFCYIIKKNKRFERGAANDKEIQSSKQIQIYCICNSYDYFTYHCDELCIRFKYS